MSAANLIAGPTSRHGSQAAGQDTSRKTKAPVKSTNAIQITGIPATKTGMIDGNFQGTENSKIVVGKVTGAVTQGVTSGTVSSKTSINRNQSTPEYHLQRESDDFDVKNTLVDAVNFFLTGLESAKLLQNDPELQELCSRDEVGKNFTDFAAEIHKSAEKKSASLASFIPKLKEKDQLGRLEQYLGLLSKGVAVPLLKEKLTDSPQLANPQAFPFSQVATRFVQSSQNANSESTSASSLLIVGLYLDHPSSNPNLPVEEMRGEILSGLAQISAWLDNNWAQSTFAHILAELERANIPDGFDFDETAENAVTHFREWQLGQYIHESSGINIGAGQSLEIKTLGARFTRYDLSNNFTIGVMKLSPSLIANTANRQFTFCFQDGRKYYLKKIPVLPEIVFNDVHLKPEQLLPLYPNVSAAVEKLESVEPFAKADFDWVHLQYNMFTNTYYWSIDNLPAPSDHTLAAQQQILYAIKRKAGAFKLTGDSLVVPIHRTKSEFYTRTQDGNGAVPLLFVKEDAGDATVGELLDFVNGAFEAAQLARPLTKKLEPKDLLIAALGSKSSAKLAQRKREVFKSRDQKLRDVIAGLGIEAAVLKTQAIPFEVILNSKDAREADSSLPTQVKAQKDSDDSKIISVRRTDMIKSNLSQFFTFLFKNFLAKQTYLNRLHLLRNRTPGFWLPSILILDVRTIGERLVSPFDDLRISEITSKMLHDNGMVISTNYVPIGLICQLKQIQEEYYPVRVSWGQTPTAIGYLGKQVKANRGQLDDTFIQFVVLQRREAEIDEEN